MEVDIQHFGKGSFNEIRLFVYDFDFFEVMSCPVALTWVASAELSEPFFTVLISSLVRFFSFLLLMSM